MMLPAPVKLFSLLVDTVGEQQEGAGPGLNGSAGDEEWEDASDDGLPGELASLGPGGRLCCDIVAWSSSAWT